MSYVTSFCRFESFRDNLPINRVLICFSMVFESLFYGRLRQLMMCRFTSFCRIENLGNNLIMNGISGVFRRNRAERERERERER
jgi:hypothetical protein